MSVQDFDFRAIVPPDAEDDFPRPGRALETLPGPLELPEIVYGAGSFSNSYNTDDHLQSEIPVRTIRLALRYGIRAFDTSAYYGPSEIVLGRTLEALRDEFPRSSYKLMTKCGRYGMSNFDYSPQTIRESVLRSLERLKTDYLDVVYLHDVEFIGESVVPQATGNVVSALGEEAEAYGLNPGNEGKIKGDGDRKILAAFAELRKLKAEGLVRQIGITGYPLPTLLRLALLILHNPPHEPIDALLSYSHLCLQNSNFSLFLDQFKERAKIQTVVAASPLNMGLLTRKVPAWHPAPLALRQAVEQSQDGWEGDFANLALGYSMSRVGKGEVGRDVPLAIGFSNPGEVHETMRVWREIKDADGNDEKRKAGEERTKEIIEKAGYLDWSWASP
ncbi:Aldo/keto reductase [Coprinopsis sp. MPI-PUGE-AT-0042]|nr:Aldo/keto reductase [Coprinopsis sp. MPI-PUGE-AT-0042]